MPLRLPRPLHSWTLTPRAAIAVQRRLAGRVISRISPGPLRFVAGLDAAFSRDGTACVAAVVLWDVQDSTVRESHVAWRPVRFPYIPGLLTFREAPALLAALRKLNQRPDVLMCDGQGWAHPRRFGIACHMGVATDLPSLGCAKSVLIGTFQPPGLRRGSTSPLSDGETVIGVVIRTRQGIRPVIVSVGHRLDLATARDLILRCTAGFRLPEPTRLADRLAAQAKRALG